jgi:hypothetical protein
MNLLHIKKLVLPLALIAVFFSACDKPDTTPQLADKGQHLINFVNYGSTNPDFGFNTSSLVFSDPTSTSEILDVQLEYSTNQVSDQDISVTVSLDTAAVATYNATQTDPLKKYSVLPSNAYTFATTTVKIKAGQMYSETFPVEFNPSVIDPSINLMLPISITAISGAPADVKAGPSSGTAYFHFIGNPLAGTYNHYGTRYNYTGAVSWTPGPVLPSNPVPLGYGSTTDLHAYAATKFAAPVDALNIVIDRVANTPPSPGYYITATGPTGDVYSSINVAYNTTFTTTYSQLQSFVEYTPPSVGVKPKFTIYTHYNNAGGGGGDDRIIIEIFEHQ